MMSGTLGGIVFSMCAIVPGHSNCREERELQ